MQIKKIAKNDIQDVVRVHKLSFDDFFLTELGNHFLSVYYNSIRKFGNGCLIGVYDKKELVGFCAATLYSSGFNQQLIKSNFFSFALVAVKLLFTSPKSLVRLYKNFTKKSDVIDDDGDYAELFSIAVNPQKQGLGIGKKLINALENEFKLKKCEKISLTTDYYNNDKTIQFYKSLGYDIMYEFIAYPERKMYRMIKNINQ